MTMRGRKRSPGVWIARPQGWALLVALVITASGFSLSAALPQKAASVRLVPKQIVDLYNLPVQTNLPVVERPDCTRQACLALTFDDGPDSDYTPVILDALNRHHIRATFFVTGLHAERHPDLVRREYQAGHEIGNHSWDHADFTKLGPAQIQDEITQTQRVIMAAGVPAPTLFRPPYGAVNEVVLSHVPLTIVRWNIDPEDWKVKRAQNIIEQTNQAVRPGGVIILHDTEQYTAEALDGLLQQLEGSYQFVTASELLHLPPGQRGQYFGR